MRLNEDFFNNHNSIEISGDNMQNSGTDFFVNFSAVIARKEYVAVYYALENLAWISSCNVDISEPKPGVLNASYHICYSGTFEVKHAVDLIIIFSRISSNYKLNSVTIEKDSVETNVSLIYIYGAFEYFCDSKNGTQIKEENYNETAACIYTFYNTITGDIPYSSDIFNLMPQNCMLNTNVCSVVSLHKIGGITQKTHIIDTKPTFERGEIYKVLNMEAWNKIRDGFINTLGEAIAIITVCYKKARIIYEIDDETVDALAFEMISPGKTYSGLIQDAYKNMSDPFRRFYRNSYILRQNFPDSTAPWGKNTILTIPYKHASSETGSESDLYIYCLVIFGTEESIEKISNMLFMPSKNKITYKSWF